MTTWQDTTSYSRGSMDRTPREWTVEIAGESICIHRLPYEPLKWFLSCWFTKDRVLLSTNVEVAKYEAIHAVMEFLTVATADCERLLTPGPVGGRT